MSALGEAIGKYQLLGELGRGGMGVVYRAYDPHLQRHVAIKVLAPHLAQDPATQARFLSEARAAASLQHPNIVGVYEAGENDGYSYFVMELVEGEDLAGRIESGGALNAEEAFPLLEKVAAALDCAHSRGLIHRDVKPANVLLGSGEPKVADFGIARIAGGTHHTQTGMLIGTPHYMAPEIWDGKEASPASDQYALGIMAYEVLVGRPPFEGESFMAIGLKHISGPVPKVGSQNVQGRVSSAVGAAFGRVLAKDPTKRYGSCREFVTALMPELVEGRRRSRILGAVIGVAVVATLGTAVVMMWPGAKPHLTTHLPPDPRIVSARRSLTDIDDQLADKEASELPKGVFLKNNQRDLESWASNANTLVSFGDDYNKALGYCYIAQENLYLAIDSYFNYNNSKFEKELDAATDALHRSFSSASKIDTHLKQLGRDDIASRVKGLLRWFHAIGGETHLTPEQRDVFARLGRDFDTLGNN